MKFSRIVVAASILALGALVTTWYMRRAREPEVIVRSEIANRSDTLDRPESGPRPKELSPSGAHVVHAAPESELARAVGPPRWHPRAAGVRVQCIQAQLADRVNWPT